jgi:hypothetical protein
MFVDRRAALFVVDRAATSFDRLAHKAGGTPKTWLRRAGDMCEQITCEILAAKTWLVAQPTGEGFQVEIGLSICALSKYALPFFSH